MSLLGRTVEKLLLVGVTAVGAVMASLGLAQLAGVFSWDWAQDTDWARFLLPALGRTVVGSILVVLTTIRLRGHGQKSIRSRLGNLMLALLGAALVFWGAGGLAEGVSQEGISALLDPEAVFFGAPLIGVGLWCCIGASTNLLALRRRSG